MINVTIQKKRISPDFLLNLISRSSMADEPFLSWRKKETNGRSSENNEGNNERNAAYVQVYSRPPIRCSNLAALIRVVCRIENRIPRTCFHVHVRSPE